MNCFGIKAPMAVVLGAVVVSSPVLLPLSRAESERRMHPGASVVRLERDVPELMKKGGVPGLAIALIRGGKTTWVQGFGVKDAKTGQPVAGFGKAGIVDLKLDDDQQMDLITGEVGYHSTPIIAKDVVMVGAAHRHLSPQQRDHEAASAPVCWAGCWGCPPSN